MNGSLYPVSYDSDRCGTRAHQKPITILSNENPKIRFDSSLVFAQTKTDLENEQKAD